MAFNISYIYQIKDKYSATADKIKSKNAGIAKSFEFVKDISSRVGSKFASVGRLMASTASKIKQKIKGIGEAFKSLQGKISRAGDKLLSLGKNLSFKVTAPILAIAGFALKSAADIETLGVAFESMTGSATQSAKIVKGLISFAAKTPFQLIGIGKAAKQLLAAGVTVDNLQGKLKFLGDISAGANVPLSDMASIFAKSKAKGKAMTEELLQLSDRGIPIIGVLAKKLKLPKDAIFDLASKGQISFGILESALISMSEKGGVFADQMKKQSNTMAGVWSTLKDNIGLALASIGDQIVTTFDLKNTINKVIGYIQEATSTFNKFTKENPRLAKLAIIMIGVAAAIGPIAIVVGTVATSFAVLAAGAVAAGVSVAAFIGPAAIATGVIAGIGGAIVLLIAFWDDLEQAMQNIVDFWSGPMLSGLAVVSDTIKGIMGLIGLSEGEVAIDVRTQQRDSEKEAILGRLRGSGVASQTMTNNARIDGEINVNAPAGAVKSVQSKTSGASIGGLGLNMAGEPG